MSSPAYRRPLASARGAALFYSERAISYVLPLVVVALVWPLTAGLHFYIGDSPLWMSVLTVGCCYLASVTWTTWGARRKETRVLATIFVSVVLSWAVIAVAIRPWHPDVAKAYVLGAPVLAVSWMIRHAALSGVRDSDKARESGEDNGMLDRIKAFAKSKVTKSEEGQDELRQTVKLDAPTTAKQAQDAREELASLAGVGADQVKIVKVKGDESQVEVAVTRAADLSKPILWADRPRHLGKSIADAPIWLGRRADGSDIEWWICGDPERNRPVAHTKFTGVSGSGKTETMVSALLQMRDRVDITPVVGDPAKFAQSFGDIEDMLSLTARDEESVKRLIWNFKQVIGYRSGLFASLTRSDGGKGYKEWVPEMWTLHRVPFVFLDLEEAADIAVKMDEELDELLRKLRSVGVHVCLSMQTMPFDNISRKTRGALAQSVAHGQIEDQDAKYSLRPETREAGADPTKWGNGSPGSVYAEVVGTDKSHWPIDGRAPKRSAADTQKAREESRPYWAEMDPGTYRILSAGLAVLSSDEQENELVKPLEGDVDDDFSDPFDPSAAGEDGVDISQPLAPPTVPFTVGEPVLDANRMTDEMARGFLWQRIEVLARSGRTEIQFRDLSDVPKETGKSRAWIYRELDQWAGEGKLRELTPPNGQAIYGIVTAPEDPPVLASVAG